ncbi:hypothetical protein MKW94_019628 [Papaver nudicaule]|uniref:Uncharacterized protein n=1 Tax=Papaver nudicaule TaxID=74823 RepID=A0AA41VUL4_PAPNU|nr:hypothetical protein [Papaver nudicaule]
MYSIWLYLKENVSCKSTDFIGYCQGKVCDKNKRSKSKKKNKSRVERMSRDKKMVRSLSFRPLSYGQERFYQLNVGDPSRNIIEKIFQTSTAITKNASTIERVLRVRNSAETLERFEEYREMVKKQAKYCNDSITYHPRSVVDGNEVLRFYSTTMSCCSRQMSKVSELCHNADCDVCRMIRTGFDTDDTMKTGIQLNAHCDSSSGFIENLVFVDKREHVKRAVVICRVIAGSSANMVDDQIGSDYEEGFDSEGSNVKEGLCSKLEHLSVRNSNAVLPCFVIIFAE